MKYFEGTQEEYVKAAADYKKKNNSLSGFTDKVGFFKDSKGETFKVRVKEGGRLSLASIKSYKRYQAKRRATEKAKTEAEAQYISELKKQAKAQTESTETKFVTGDKPVIAEHDVRLASGGSSEYMSISDKLVKVNGSIRFQAGSTLPLLGLAATTLSAGQAFAAGDVREGTARTLEGVAGEIPIVGDIIQPETVAGGTFEDVERRTAEGMRAKELQQRAAEARQRGGKLSLGLGTARFTLPEFGLSELMGIN